MRALDDEKKAKFAVKECVEHKLLDAYPVLIEKDGARSSKAIAYSICIACAFARLQASSLRRSSSLRC